MINHASNDSASPGAACVYSACILMTRGPAGQASNASAASGETQAALLALCLRFVTRVEAVTMERAPGALLDLGYCAADEARAVCATLLARARKQVERIERNLDVRVGAGPSLTLARLAALAAPPGGLRFITPAERAAFLAPLPINLLASVEPESVTPELIAQLHQYGLDTIGRTARLAARDPHTLRRQFGQAGAALATLARGDDPRPLRHTPAPARIHARRRFSPAATPDQALNCLPDLALRIAQRLQLPQAGERQEGRLARQGSALSLRIVWETGGESHVRRRLARPHWQPGELAQAARGLLLASLASALAPERSPRDGEDGEGGERVVALTMTLGALSARQSAQPVALFHLPDRAGRLAEQEQSKRFERIAVEVAAPLAYRYGKATLYRLTDSHPDAILPEERHRLIEVTRSSARPHNRPARAITRRGAMGKPLDPPPLTPQPHWW